MGVFSAGSSGPVLAVNDLLDHGVFGCAGHQRRVRIPGTQGLATVIRPQTQSLESVGDGNPTLLSSAADLLICQERLSILHPRPQHTNLRRDVSLRSLDLLGLLLLLVTGLMGLRRWLRLAVPIQVITVGQFLNLLSSLDPHHDGDIRVRRVRLQILHVAL